MKFRNQYDKIEPHAFLTNPGDPIRQDYIADEDGNPVPSGKTNLYDEIQSHRASVELSTLLQRYAAGDETALNQIQGVYADVVDAPSSLQEFHERVRTAKNTFGISQKDLESFLMTILFNMLCQSEPPSSSTRLSRLIKRWISLPLPFQILLVLVQIAVAIIIKLEVL